MSLKIVLVIIIGLLFGYFVLESDIGQNYIAVSECDKAINNEKSFLESKYPSGRSIDKVATQTFLDIDRAKTFVEKWETGDMNYNTGDSARKDLKEWDEEGNVTIGVLKVDWGYLVYGMEGGGAESSDVYPLVCKDGEIMKESSALIIRLGKL